MVALAALMSSIDSTIVAVGIPTFLDELQTSLVLVGWVLTAYQLTMTMMMPTVGKLADVLHRKQVFLGCIALFTVGSLLCSLAPNIYVLIGARIIQAIGGGGLMPSATGIVNEKFPDKRMQMIGLFSSVMPIGGIVGPNLGGIILTYLSWRGLFYVNIPIGVIVFISMLLWLKVKPPTSTKKVTIDVKGMALYAPGIAALMLALTILGNSDFGPELVAVVGLTVAGVGLLYYFIRFEARTPAPLIEVHLLKQWEFFFANLYNFFYGFCVFGVFALIPYYGVVYYGFSDTEAGTVLTARAVAMITCSAIASIYIIRLGYRRPMMFGMLALSAIFLLLGRGLTDVTLLGIHFSNFGWLATVMALAGVCVGFTNPASNNAILDLMPERISAITGLRGMFRQTGGMFGVALITMYVNHQANKGVGLMQVYDVLAVLLIFIATYVVRQIPDSAKNRRIAAQSATTTRTPAPVAGGSE
jgi:EmrB/QacA subfamily drug resistance transporter